MRDTVLFDLDGTLLPIDNDAFMALYFGALKTHFDGVYEYPLLKQTVLMGTEAMIRNAGEHTNEMTFWRLAEQMMPLKYETAIDKFTAFYETAFEQARAAAWANPDAAACVAMLKARGYTLVAATNPVFPRVATLNRLRWAGLDPDDFALITTYENCHACKPNLAYYEEVLDELGVPAEACIMVGNDNQEDMIAEALGMRGYLITDCLINRDEAPITCHWHGSFAEFKRLIEGGAL